MKSLANAPCYLQEKPDLFTSLYRFYQLAPDRPYCTGQKGVGLLVRPKMAAFEHPYVQHNPPAMQHWMTFDVDHDNPFIWKDTGLPAPNLVVRNLNDSKCHMSYGVESICTSEAAKRKPVEYMAAIQNSYCARLQADHSYTGLITKNPLHDDYHVQHIHDAVYSLSELADYVELQTRYWTRKRATNDEHYGLGRNCALFYRLRYWAYDHVNDYREQHRTYDDWMRAVLSRSEGFNEFPKPLPYSEVKSTAKSVGKWVWTKYWPEGKRKKRGAMADSFKDSQMGLCLTTRQRLSARRTNELQRIATEERIIQAIGQLTAQGKRVTKAEVSRLAGIDRAKLYRDYGHLFVAEKV